MKAMSSGDPSSEKLIQATTYPKSQNKDRSMLEFRDHEKVNGVLNDVLPFVIIVTVTYHTVAGLLIDDRSSYNILYDDALEQLGLCQLDLNPCKGGYLLIFKNFITHLTSINFKR